MGNALQIDANSIDLLALKNVSSSLKRVQYELVADTVKVFGKVHEKEESRFLMLDGRLEDVVDVMSDLSAVSAREVSNLPGSKIFV